jgi:hypothetical protein
VSCVHECLCALVRIVLQIDVLTEADPPHVGSEYAGVSKPWKSEIKQWLLEEMSC